jgi:hypothetical protein
VIFEFLWIKVPSFRRDDVRRKVKHFLQYSLIRPRHRPDAGQFFGIFRVGRSNEQLAWGSLPLIPQSIDRATPITAAASLPQNGAAPVATYLGLRIN